MEDDGEKAHIMVRAEVEEVETGVSHDLSPDTSCTPDPLSGPRSGNGLWRKETVVLIKLQLRRETNTFFFTMAVEDGKPIGRTVVPSTYAESMHYLEGKRRLQMGDEMRRLYQGGMES